MFVLALRPIGAVAWESPFQLIMTLSAEDSHWHWHSGRPERAMGPVDRPEPAPKMAVTVTAQ